MFLKLISVITVSKYDDEALVRTLRSLHNQIGAAEIEHVIIFGGNVQSCDIGHLLDQLSRDKNKISIKTKVQKHSEDGIFTAMNKGLEIATGKYVGFLNAGDVLASVDVVSTLEQNLEENPGSSMVYGDVTILSNCNFIHRKWISGEFCPRKLLFGWMCPHPMTFIKRSLIDKIGTFNQEMPVTADYDFLRRVIMAEGCQPLYVPKTLVVMEPLGVSKFSIKNFVISSKECYLSWQQARLKMHPFWILIFKPLRKIFQIRIVSANK